MASVVAIIIIQIFLGCLIIVQSQTLCVDHTDCPSDRFCTSGGWCEECKDCNFFRNTIDYGPFDGICPHMNCGYICNNHDDCSRKSSINDDNDDENGRLFCVTPPSAETVGSVCWDCSKVVERGLYRGPIVQQYAEAEAQDNSTSRNVSSSSTSTSSCASHAPCLCRSTRDCPDDHYCASSIEIDTTVVEDTSTTTGGGMTGDPSASTRSYTMEIMDDDNDDNTGTGSDSVHGVCRGICVSCFTGLCQDLQVAVNRSQPLDKQTCDVICPYTNTNTTTNNNNDIALPSSSSDDGYHEKDDKRGGPLMFGAWVGIIFGIQLVLFIVICRRPLDRFERSGTENIPRRRHNSTNNDNETVASTVVDEKEDSSHLNNNNVEEEEEDDDAELGCPTIGRDGSDNRTSYNN
jgi:hypothetical protein